MVKVVGIGEPVLLPHHDRKSMDGRRTSVWHGARSQIAPGRYSVACPAVDLGDDIGPLTMDCAERHATWSAGHQQRKFGQPKKAIRHGLRRQTTLIHLGGSPDTG